MSDKRGEMLVRVSLGRKIAIAVTSALAVVGAVVELSPLGGNRLHWIQMLPIVGLAIAGVCALLAPLAAQIVARAIQWSNLVLGLMLTAAASPYDDGLHTGLFLVLGCGSALWPWAARDLSRESAGRASYLSRFAARFSC